MASDPPSSRSAWSLTELESLCHRVGLSLESGIAMAETCRAEAEITRGRKRQILDQVAKRLTGGEHAAAALEESHAFPTLLVDMTRVGEETGKLGEVYLKLANHYRDLVRARRVFWQGITWPLMQAVAGLLVITLFLLALAWLQRRVPIIVPYDLFQLGLSPLQNLALMWSVLLAALAIPLLVAWRVRRGSIGSLLARGISRLPLVGRTWERMATSRFAWAFGTAIDAGIGATTAIRLGLRGSNHPPFQRREAEIVRSIERGESFERSLRQSGAFPVDLVQAVAVGERTGRVTESLERLSEDYEEQSALSLRRLGQVSGLVVSLSVFALLGLSVLSMYAGYMGEVSEALKANTKTLAELRGATLPGASQAAQSDNSIIQSRDNMVKDIIESDSFKQIESIYSQLGRYGEVSDEEFLDGLLGDSPAQRRAKALQEQREKNQEKTEK